MLHIQTWWCWPAESGWLLAPDSNMLTLATAESCSLLCYWFKHADAGNFWFRELLSQAWDRVDSSISCWLVLQIQACWVRELCWRRQLLNCWDVLTAWFHVDLDLVLQIQTYWRWQLLIQGLLSRVNSLILCWPRVCAPDSNVLTSATAESGK